MLKKAGLPPVWLSKMRPDGYFSQIEHVPESDLKHSLKLSVQGREEVCDEQIISSSIRETQSVSLSSVLFCFVFEEGDSKVWHCACCPAGARAAVLYGGGGCWLPW